MLNERLIDDAMKLIENFLEESGVAVSTAYYRPIVEEWYRKSDITDAETLAAISMYCYYNDNITWNEIQDVRDYYFASIDELLEKAAQWDENADAYLDALDDPNNISMEELKAAEEDAMYW